jgi:hypothetical protein
MGRDAGAAVGGNHWPARAFGGRDGPMANSSIEYRRHAENCLRLAEHAGSPDARSLLLMMASAWHRLAQDVENIERPLGAGTRPMPQKKDKQMFEPGNRRDDLADFLAKRTKVAPVDFPTFGQNMAKIIMAAKSKPRLCDLSPADQKKFGTARGWDCKDLKFFVGRINFTQLGKQRTDELNSVPTRFNLAPGGVEMVIAAGRDALRANATFQAFLLNH